MMANKKTRVLIASCLCVIILLPILTGCSLEEFSGIGSIIPEKHSGFYINGEKIELDLPENGLGYFEKLSDDQKKIYSAAVVAIDAGVNRFTCAGIDYKEYLDVYGEALTALLYDHPEYFWISGEAIASAEYIDGTEYGNVEIELSVYDYWWEADLFSAQEMFEKAVSDIVNEASALESDYDKVKFVHDLLIKNVSYDYDSYDAGNSIDAESEALVNTAYGAIISRRAMCGGYARAFGHIMRKLGIDTSYVTGIVDGGSHAWNIIELGGEYYHIDLTWDDPDGDPCDVLHSYFCVTNEDILKTHAIDPEFEYIEATATEYNYYIREGLYLEFYNFSTIKNMFQSFEGDVLLTFKCANKYVFNEAVESLIDKQRIYELEGMSELESYSYALDNEHYILTFFID